ncbi:MAG TPA: hypothetical protein VFS69_02615 [Sphingomicrobium sp.]|nr:hypothetical protein [Sphingomicrobium sp.]
MRILLLAATVALLPQASTAAPAGASKLTIGPEAPKVIIAPAVESAIKAPPSECRKPTAYIAHDGLIWPNDKLEPRKLTELPPAQGFMAVYRVTNGCEDPMTMVEYRTGRRR